MSYQVNFRLFFPDREYWEAEQISQLRSDLQKACEKVIDDHALTRKAVVVSSAEVTYLTK